MFYLYGHSMYVSHIAISWLWYSCTLVIIKNKGWRLTSFNVKDNSSIVLLSYMKLKLA